MGQFTAMCARVTLTKDDIDGVAESLDAEIAAEDIPLYRPRYNVAPSDVHWIAAAGADRPVLRPAVWGYMARGKPLINVRGEQLGTATGFRDAFQSRRCVVVTDGFFEWDEQRSPYWFHRADGGLVLLAGLYQNPEQPAARPRFTVLTTRPNQLVAPIHDRMPVVIAAEHLRDWLTIEPAGAVPLITPAPEGGLVVTAVSRRVNSVRNDDAACLATADPHADRGRQGSLF